MYIIHILYGIIYSRGHCVPIILVLCNFQGTKIDGFEQKDTQVKALRTSFVQLLPYCNGNTH